MALINMGAHLKQVMELLPPGLLINIYPMWSNEVIIINSFEKEGIATLFAEHPELEGSFVYSALFEDVYYLAIHVYKRGHLNKHS